MNVRTIIITYMEDWFVDDILSWYKFSNGWITEEDKAILDAREWTYNQTHQQQDYLSYKQFKDKLIARLGIEIIGFKKFKSYVIDDQTNKINIDYVNNLKNASIICDEIHNTYATE